MDRDDPELIAKIEELREKGETIADSILNAITEQVLMKGENDRESITIIGAALGELVAKLTMLINSAYEEEGKFKPLANHFVKIIASTIEAYDRTNLAEERIKEVIRLHRQMQEEENSGNG